MNRKSPDYDKTTPKICRRFLGTACIARFAFLFIAALIWGTEAQGKKLHIVVADSATRSPLPNASIFDRKGHAIGMSGPDGRLPSIPSHNYPITVRYLGFQEKCVHSPETDTVFLKESLTDLPELIVETRQHRLLHMLAYVREYSTLTTYTDTVFLFREKMVDYILPKEKKGRFKGWTRPRILKSESYYHFTDADGLDSVSDNCNHHFSWSDWVGVIPAFRLSPPLVNREAGADTVMGRYSPAEIWRKDGDRVTVDVNVLADTKARKWAPDMHTFFRKGLDFDNFKVRFNYDNVLGDTISAENLTGYSFSIESNGRGHNMFRFNKSDESFFVSTYAEVYILDKEYISLKEAKKWERIKIDSDEIVILKPLEASELQPSIVELMSRVANVDSGQIRLDLPPDRSMISRNIGKANFSIGHRALTLLKDLTGITAFKAHKNRADKWKEFSRQQIRRNHKTE